MSSRGSTVSSFRLADSVPPFVHPRTEAREEDNESTEEEGNHGRQESPHAD